MAPPLTFTRTSMSTSGAPSQTRPRTRSQVAAVVNAQASTPAANSSNAAGSSRVLRPRDDSRRQPEHEHVNLCQKRLCYCRCRSGVTYCKSCLCDSCVKLKARIKKGNRPKVDFFYCPKCMCDTCLKKLVFCKTCACSMCHKRRVHSGFDDESGPWSKRAEESAATRTQKRKRPCDVAETEFTPSTPKKRAKEGSSAGPDRKDTAAAKGLLALRGKFTMPKGAKRFCALSLSHGGKKDAIEACHILALATSSTMITKLEYAWNIEPLTFHIHTSNNLLLLLANYHTLFDANAWALVPMERSILNAMEEFSDGTAPANIETIADIYETAGKTDFEYALLPLTDFGFVVRLEGPDFGNGVKPPSTLYVFPYEGFPRLSLHIHPHFAICNLMEKYNQLDDSERREVESWIGNHNPTVALHLEQCEALYTGWMATEVPEGDLTTSKLRKGRKKDDDGRTSKSEPQGYKRGNTSSAQKRGDTNRKGARAGPSRLGGQVKKRGDNAPIQDSSPSSLVVPSETGTIADDHDHDNTDYFENDEMFHARICDWLDELDTPDQTLGPLFAPSRLAEENITSSVALKPSSQCDNLKTIEDKQMRPFGSVGVVRSDRNIGGGSMALKPKYAVSGHKTQRGIRPSQESRRTLVEGPGAEDAKLLQVTQSLEHLDLAL